MLFALHMSAFDPKQTSVRPLTSRMALAPAGQPRFHKALSGHVLYRPGPSKLDQSTRLVTGRGGEIVVIALPGFTGSPAVADAGGVGNVCGAFSALIDAGSGRLCG